MSQSSVELEGSSYVAARHTEGHVDHGHDVALHDVVLAGGGEGLVKALGALHHGGQLGERSHVLLAVALLAFLDLLHQSHLLNCHTCNIKKRYNEVKILSFMQLLLHSYKVFIAGALNSSLINFPIYPLFCIYKK